jgi:hypothetical protein
MDQQVCWRQIVGRDSGGAQPMEDEEGATTVEGTRSGFVRDSLGHIVSTLIFPSLCVQFYRVSDKMGAGSVGCSVGSRGCTLP